MSVRRSLGDTGWQSFVTRDQLLAASRHPLPPSGHVVRAVLVVADRQTAGWVA